MDRQIVYPGAIPLETDLLNTNKYSMIGLAKLSSAIMGTNTYLHGLQCTASSPASMVVSVAAGEIYSLENIDGTAYSSLNADTTNTILKQGVISTASQFTLTAPTTSGQSINYLIQVTYSDTDSGATVLPYYNASTPSVAYSGPNNSGTAQNTVRSGVCTVSLKAGVPAATGTQTTPSTDTGYIAAWVITVAQGATTVTAANISQATGAPFIPASGLVDGIQKKLLTHGTDIGTANAYAVNYSPAITSLTDGMELTFKATNTNTGASVFSQNGNASYPIIKIGGSVLSGGEIYSGGYATVKWNAALSSWVLISSTGASSALLNLGAASVTGSTAQKFWVASAPGDTNAAVPVSLLNTQTAGRLLNVQIFTASGTYTPTTGTNSVIVEAVGGGGGGGGTYTTTTGYYAVAGGGGPGGYGKSRYTGGFSGEAITIGSGGGAGAANATTDGGTGGTTSFGSLLICNGGGGGTFCSAWSTSIHSSGAPSGTVTGANISWSGSNAGVPGYVAANGWLSGGGGSSPFGRGGLQQGTASTGNATGVIGTGYGSGGSGAACANGATGTSGGAGTAGVVIIWEYA